MSTTSMIGAICGYCGKSAGFRRGTVVDCDENDQEVKVEVRECNHCGEFNGQQQVWFPRLTRGHENKEHE